MAKKGKKEKKQDAAAAEEASPQEVAAESPQSAAPIKKENQIEPATPPAPQDEPPAQEDPPAQQEDRQSEEAPAVGATPAEENIDGDASAPTPGASQAVPVSPIPKAPPGSCAVCRGRSNVGTLPFPCTSCRELTLLQRTPPCPARTIFCSFPAFSDSVSTGGTSCLVGTGW